MNQLELILENIRLSQIEKILLESSTQQEAQRGIDLINESIYMAGNLLQENMFQSNQLEISNNHKINNTNFAANDSIETLIKKNQAKLDNIERLKQLKNNEMKNPSSSLNVRFHPHQFTKR
jgi:hypothetical protein